MKNILKCTILISVTYLFTACDINRNPISDFSELNIGGTSQTGKRIKFLTKAEMENQYNELYKSMKDGNSIEKWFMDYLVYTDTHADNAYRGAIDIELTQLEQQSQNGDNKNIKRDWDVYLQKIGVANQIIFNIDSVPDTTLTKVERKQWKAEALIFRSMMYFDMVRLWGDVQLFIHQLPDINAQNFAEVYPLYYPARDSVSKVYRQIIQDLTIALEPGGAPDLNPANKFLLTKTLANALLAKIYAEKPVRDYAKVIEYAQKVENDNLSLVSKYSDLFGMKADNTDALRNTSESIFEITYGDGQNWIWMMYGVNAADPKSVYDWAKWCTPSRDLIAAFDKEGDTERKNQTIINAKVTWSNHYPSNNYAHMYKYRSNFSSVIKVRLADILLLKAEALVEQGSLSEAVVIVNKIRRRAKLPDLTSDIASSKALMQDAVLNERRLELAFEGQRWFDLVRTDKVFQVMNTLNSRDAGRAQMEPIIPDLLLLPIPQSVVEINKLMVQNPGY